MRRGAGDISFVADIIPGLDGLGAVGSAAECREQIDAFMRAGATPVVFPFAAPGPAARASALETFRAFP